MDAWDTLIKLGATLMGAIAGIFGEWNMLLTALVVVMTLDYISGVIVAITGHSPKTQGGKLDSKAGFVGLAKKAIMMIVVLLAMLLDRALGTDAQMFQTACVCYYIANEGISIIENAGLMGLPVPDVILKALEQFRDKDKPEE